MIGILILGLFFIGLGIWFFICGRNSKGYCYKYYERSIYV